MIASDDLLQHFYWSQDSSWGGGYHDTATTIPAQASTNEVHPTISALEYSTSTH
jgi:hypothetical protein